MARKYSAEDVLAMLEENEENEVDDPQEVIMEGTDDDLEDVEDNACENGEFVFKKHENIKFYFNRKL